MDSPYLFTPVLAWFTAGSLKFLVNSIRTRQLAFNLIGYGGFPSTHSAIVGATAALIALREGFWHPAFGVAVTFAFITVLDAASLRRQVGHHAAALNRMNDDDPDHQPLREQVGHSHGEIVAGLLVGLAVAVVVNGFTPA